MDINQELQICAKKPAYFIENYCKFYNYKTSKYEYIKLRPYQKQVLKNYQKNRFNIVVNARQMGMSTINEGYTLHQLLFNINKTIGIASSSGKKSWLLEGSVKHHYKILPNFFKIFADIEFDGNDKFELNNGSKLVDPYGYRAKLDLVIIDDAAFDEDLDEKMIALFPALGADGSLIATSTPGFANKWFQTAVENAREDKNGFHLTELPWHLKPDTISADMKQYQRTKTQEAFEREYECKFTE